MKTHHPKIKTYLLVFGILMVLTVVTVAVSYLHFPVLVAVPLGLAIATFKASLVAAFFMHLKGERALIYGLLGMTLVFTAVLFILPIADTTATANARLNSSAPSVEEHHVP